MASKSEILFCVSVVFFIIVGCCFSYLGYKNGETGLCEELFNEGVFNNGVCYIKTEDGSLKPAKLFLKDINK